MTEGGIAHVGEGHGRRGGVDRGGCRRLRRHRCLLLPPPSRETAGRRSRIGDGDQHGESAVRIAAAAGRGRRSSPRRFSDQPSRRSEQLESHDHPRHQLEERDVGTGARRRPALADAVQFAQYPLAARSRPGEGAPDGAGRRALRSGHHHRLRHAGCVPPARLGRVRRGSGPISPDRPPSCRAGRAGRRACRRAWGASTRGW